MSSHAQPGSLQIPEAAHSLPATAHPELEAAVRALAEQRAAWLAVDLAGRVDLLERLARGVEAVAADWVRDAIGAKGIGAGTPAELEEWLGGPYATLRNLRLLAGSLRSLRDTGRIPLPGKARVGESGQVALPVFPTDFYDRVTAPGFSAELWLEPGVTLDDLPALQATAYREKSDAHGKVALVLGAGNVSSIGPMDLLHKLFVEHQVCVLKMNPVNAYVGPHLERAFAPLVERGFLRIVYGGAAEGEYLCRHPAVDEIHITGSDKTHDAIVYGTGDEGRDNKARRAPINRRRITSELGNVSPVIVVPGPWSESDLRFQAENLVSMLANNAGFNCNATRVVVTHAGWSQRGALLDEMAQVFAEVKERVPYYPGARARYEAFIAAHPDALRIGDDQHGKVPWTLITGLSPEATDDICFTTEAFCAVMGETPLPADSPDGFIERAVQFCNDTLWGTLNASMLVHPASLRDPKVAAAVERAISELRYGTVVVNHWAGLGYGFVSTSWGAYPGHVDHDIRSGRGVVHNTYLLDRVQKSVIRGPFRVWPKPPWFVTKRAAHRLGPCLVKLEARPSLGRLLAVAARGLSG